MQYDRRRLDFDFEGIQLEPYLRRLDDIFGYEYTFLAKAILADMIEKCSKHRSHYFQEQRRLRRPRWHSFSVRERPECCNTRIGQVKSQRHRPRPRKTSLARYAKSVTVHARETGSATSYSPRNTEHPPWGHPPWLSLSRVQSGCPTTFAPLRKVQFDSLVVASPKALSGVGERQS